LCARATVRIDAARSETGWPSGLGDWFFEVLAAKKLKNLLPP